MKYIVSSWGVLLSYRTNRIMIIFMYFGPDAGQPTRADDPSSIIVIVAASKAIPGVSTQSALN